jgi:HD-GYP domain-containing protein (c-di-GMP phosphodiesterase class II)
MSSEVEGKVWEHDSLLRAGRLETLELVLDDSSVSRKHAEIRATEQGWQVRDLGSTNGTFLNGVRITTGERRLHEHDVIQFGKLQLLVEALADGIEVESGPDQMLVEATTNSSWEDAVQGLAFDSQRLPRPGEQLKALFRASQHLARVENENDLLQNILNDAVAALDAQRGAIVLAEGPNGELRLRALATGRSEASSRTNFSQSLARRVFTSGESILCCSVGDDPELATAQSIHEGAMASVLCVLLRTPRKRLGVLHLDRSYWQKQFTKDDLSLADALAASVSAGIESYQLLEAQRKLFLNTITIMAQAVEMRDTYTGGHTQRVTKYSLLLAQQLKLSPQELHWVRIGTPLHDIGKIGIDDSILRKAGKLTPEEFEIMKTHTVKGAAILATIADLGPVIPIVRSHHEQWNGNGYPDALAGENIPRLARIVAVADAYDAMTSDRPYRKGMPHQVAFEEIHKCAGRQFDPECAEGFWLIRERIVEEMVSQSAPASNVEGMTRAFQLT